MKRDMNLIRELLFQLEDIPTDTIHYLKAPEGYSPDGGELSRYPAARIRLD